MTDETKAEAAPLSVEEMTEMLSLCPVTEEEHSRAIATAAELERLTKWILANDRYGGRGLLRHVSQLKAMTTTAAVAPLSVEEMRVMLNGCNVTPIERDRAVATAAGLEGEALPDLLKARDMVDRLVCELGGGK